MNNAVSRQISEPDREAGGMEPTHFSMEAHLKEPPAVHNIYTLLLQRICKRMEPRSGLCGQRRTAAKGDPVVRP